MFAECARPPLLPGVPLNTKHLLEMPLLKLKQYNILSGFYTLKSTPSAFLKPNL